MNRLLVDTHALLWWLADDRALSRAAAEAIADPANELSVSAASIWEIAIKRSLGKVRAPDGLVDHIADAGFEWLPIRAEHAWRVHELPYHHRDPFDRLLVAQAVCEQVPIISRDPNLAAYGITVHW
jgi:PIN domain nuclease of toxin-antitoxin system